MKLDDLLLTLNGVDKFFLDTFNTRYRGEEDYDDEGILILELDSCLEYGRKNGVTDEEKIANMIKAHLKNNVPKDFPYRIETEDGYLFWKPKK